MHLDASRPAGAVPAMTQEQRDAVHEVLANRRDIRSTFLPDPIDDATVLRLLEAAHRAPSVGLSQPWDFLLLRDVDTRRRVKDVALRRSHEFRDSLPAGRRDHFSTLKIEGILDTPLNIVVTCDTTRGGPHTLGRHADPRMAPFSVACAVQNLWLAARAEGIGVGWVSFFDPDEIARELGLPSHVTVVAYLCVGYVTEFPPAPELALTGWAERRPLAWAVHHDTWGSRHLPGGQAVSVFDQTISAIQPVDEQARQAAQTHHLSLTKPPGSLGCLEALGADIAAIQGEAVPPVPSPAAVAVFAGDHGVQREQQVSPWPQEVTAQMVLNFLGGGAMASVLARQVGAELSVVNVGVAEALPDAPGLVNRPVAQGTADLSTEAAMTPQQVAQALEVGIDVARDLVAQGNRLLVAGEVGIGNTTPAAALICAYLGREPQDVVGRGAGADDAMLEHKRAVIGRALELHAERIVDPYETLRCLGGFEHAAMTGFYLAAAALRVPAIVDGVIAASAALAATRLCPDVRGFLLAGHRSTEPGSALVLDALELRPLLNLDMRLGEGTGALLAVPIVQGAVRVMAEGATFESAGVSDRV